MSAPPSAPLRARRSTRRAISVGVTLAAVAAGVLTSGPGAGAWTRGEQVDLGVVESTPASLSTSGDYATDVLSNPWDFSDHDVIPIVGVGTSVADGVGIANGTLGVTTRNATEIRLLMKWPGVVPWGTDGWAHPIDGGVYTRTTFRAYAAATLSMAIRYWRADGGSGVIPFTLPAGWSVQHFDLTSPTLYPFPGATGPWSGPIVRFELFRGGAMSGGNPPVDVLLDWVRVHRADAPQEPPAGVPVPAVLTPNEEGGADYATVERGNPWDFAGTDDLGELHQLANLSVANDELSVTSTGNDPFVGLPLGPELRTDRYRRLTIDACYGGGFSLDDAPGGGMNGRIAWMPRGSGIWTETQDFVVFPGCHRMTLDMATQPPAAIHDENTRFATGWRGVGIDALRFDLHEDRGPRQVVLREVKLADDAAFSTSYPITFVDRAGAGGTAEIWISTDPRANSGRLLATVPVQAGVNTFTWNGLDVQGHTVPNATYWVNVTMRNGAGVGTGRATGPLRLERPVPPTPSRFVAVTPARVLDTRTGVGGNIAALGPQVTTELDVTGVGGVPETGVTAVVLNVTVDQPSASGYLTAWPSREPRPGVSNLNFVPGQTVPNLVTVKVGASGRIDLFNSAGFTHVIADVVGYYTADAVPGGLYTPLTPARVLDTRDGTGRDGVVGAVPGGAAIDLRVTGRGGVPATGVSAVALNVTVDQPTWSGFVTTWPTGEPRPQASTHNFVAGLTVANLVLAKVGAGGHVSLFNSSGSVHLVADVVGYFSSSGGAFVPVDPQRVVDTRDGTGGVSGSLGERAHLSSTIAGAGRIPPGATGVVVNLTSTDASERTFLTAWPSGVARPEASTVNPRPGVAVPNQAYLKLGSGGRLDVYNNSGSTNVVIDVFGYVVPVG